MEKTPTEALIGKGAKAITMDVVMIDVACNYACEDVDTCFRLRQIFRDELNEINQMSLYNDIEIPLIPVLMRMEREILPLLLKQLIMQQLMVQKSLV